jgi:hypothetical protein
MGRQGVGMAREGKEMKGMERQGKARHGMEGQGKGHAWQIVEHLLCIFVNGVVIVTLNILL